MKPTKYWVRFSKQGEAEMSEVPVGFDDFDEADKLAKSMLVGGLVEQAGVYQYLDGFSCKQVTK